MFKKALYILLSIYLCSCAKLHDAQHVLRQADSLKNESVTYDDSAQIAQATHVLNNIIYRNIYPADYAKAHYYYGRVLREHNNPAEAMKHFIKTIESSTTDNTIIARAYNNMGTISHIAGQNQLAFDMYKKAADFFHAKNDSTAYYYALNSMAYELAELRNGEKMNHFLQMIQNECKDTAVVIRTLETRARYNLLIQQYDSTIYYVNLLQKHNDCGPSAVMLKAQAFAFLENNDSAMHYANQIMEYENRDNDKINALYILTHNDSTLSAQRLLQLTSQREDIRHKKYGPLKEQHLIATQILKEHLDSKKVFLWVKWLIIFSIIALTVYIFIKKICKYPNSKRSESNNLTAKDIEKKCKQIRQIDDFKSFFGWADYQQVCYIVNNEFNMLEKKLDEKGLNEKDIRLCILVLIDKFNSKQIAKLLFYSESGIRNYKHNVAKKLNTTSTNLRKKIIEIAIN